jgi:carboxypeptidase A1
MWRKNRQPAGFCVGTDPNRNWGYEWKGRGSSSFPCSETYRGEFPFSAPEAKSMAAYIEAQGNIKTYVDFHSYSQLWMAPFGFDCSKKPKDFKFQKEAAMLAIQALKSVHGKSFTFQSACDLYPVNGDSADYTYAVDNVTFSYAVELRDTGRNGFMLPAKEIIPSGEETFAAIKAMMGYIKQHFGQ